jgi:PPOX class probable F420-dependent enzyme
MSDAINWEDETGRRALARLAREQVIWLTTVSASGVPQPRPVWFTWDGSLFTVVSEPAAWKLRHIEANPNVSLHFDAGPGGEDVQVLLGRAWIDRNAPAVRDMPDYLSKYAEGLRQINLSVERYSGMFNTIIRVQPLRLRGLAPLES